MWFLFEILCSMWEKGYWFSCSYGTSQFRFLSMDVPQQTYNCWSNSQKNWTSDKEKPDLSKEQIKKVIIINVKLKIIKPKLKWIRIIKQINNKLKLTVNQWKQ